ncbi:MULTISPECIES: terminase [Ralstonia]|uniref:Terminase n=1 Tax=Ralstonia condita TaxID=3058600 RepID=A0ABN9IFY0_9RALS|nr:MULTISPECIES: terminase [Ralstonia]MBB0023645.1 terminase [Ralstonia pickettii]MBB0096996.1 terminase [Ralstonia pickettii]MBB0107034.1 terminase [Ralstonia pickettii]MBB0127769.1 terminase [Ralstonia pickettii]MBB0160734.1 terminase [Ralstonia pickettii]
MTASVEAQLIEEIAKYSNDPLGFVNFAFPWGSGELADHQGPDEWQVDTLTDIGEKLRAGQIDAAQAIQIAVASGHGIGKSALVSWLILWAIATFEDTRGVVTANTDAQLRTKTWAELAKWYRRCICSHWFEFTATALYARDTKHEKTWRIDMVPWSERNTEAFAGLHNQGKRVLLVFDEGSAIPNIIWEVAEGALTDKDTQIIWAVFGNPTRNSGRFRECFGRFKHRWITRQIDSRTARMTNKDQLAQWVADYGEDSDFVRVRVRGVFPRAGSTQFIGSDIVEAAKSREAHAGVYDALVIGVDVARFGDDETVIYIRKGRDGRTHEPIKLRGLDTMQVAARVAEQYEFYRADAIFVDQTGVGSGVVDRLRQLRIPCTGIDNGASPDRSNPGQEATVYANKGAEMWGVMRDWLKTGGAIPENDVDLHAQLQDREYGYVLRNGRDAIQLESKKDMKKRGLSSPDIADALALTFAYPVQPNANAGRAAAFASRQVQHEYDPYATN